MGRFIDLTGMNFGRLTVLYLDAERTKEKCKTYWMCQCSCKQQTILSIRADALGKKTFSCGCYNIDSHKATGKLKKCYNKYDLESQEYGIGYTLKNEPFYFDKEDYDLIKDYCWYFKKNNNGQNTYLIANDIHSEKKTIISMHRLVMGVNDKDIDIDHIKHNLYDNRKSQLRIGNASLNGMNNQLSINNSSGCTGVWWHKYNQKWCAEIMVDNKKIYLGSYFDIEDAITARKNAEELYFGEWSYDNSQAMVTI